MAKKKKSQPQQHLSPEQFIKQRVRNLEIGKCYISKNINVTGEGNIIITRKHTGGRISLAFFLVDFYCLGVKDSFYFLRMEEMQYEEEFINGYLTDFDEISYNEAHNYIYGAVAFAEEAGITANKSFNLTQYFLEEDTDDIPLIEYEYGKDGQHFLVAHSELEASMYLSTLKENLGENFNYVVVHDNDNDEEDFDEDFDDSDEEDYQEEDVTDEDNLPSIEQEHEQPSEKIAMTEYTYVHPKYPLRLVLKNKVLKDLLFSQATEKVLSTDRIKEVMNLPHDTLKLDLEKIILYCVNQAYEKDCDALNAKGIPNAIAHAIVLVAMIGDESSLDTVLEVLRQPEEVCAKLFDKNDMERIFVPALYLLGNQKLDTLASFAKEGGLYTFMHYLVFPAMTHLFKKEPQRRMEVIEWFRNILQFATTTLPDNNIYDGYMIKFILSELLELQAKELLSEIKAIYEVSDICEKAFGTYESLVKKMNSEQ